MKVAIVTGASRGIGAATAILLAAKSYKVAVNYSKDKAGAEKIVKQIEENGGEAIAIKANMGSEEDIIKMFDKVNRVLGNVTALVNNAALNPVCPVEELTYQALEEVYKVNVFGTIIACREAVKHMKLSGGAIVNVTSEAARFGGNKMTAYASSKAAINTFTVGFAREIAPYNIRVNAVSPGVIDTDAHKAAGPEKLQAMKATLPMGRLGSPEEVAQTIVWLLSQEAAYVSGSMLTVAGAR